MKFLSIDIGSTGCKCQLFNEQGDILEYIFREYELKNIDKEIYVDIHAIVKNLKGMIAEVAQKQKFDSVAISTFGESFVLLDENDNVLFLPMIYTDSRGEKEAEELLEIFGEEKLFSITGVMPQSMFSISKLLWIKNNEPEIFKKGKKVMLICDYLGYVLTGKAVIDYSLASRTGVFDVEKKCFSKELLDKLEIDINMFSTPALAGEVIGDFLPEIKKELNIKNDCKLVLGAHDQVCTAVGAGVLSAGDAVDGLGTVECITTVFDKKPDDISMGKMGYPCVPFAIDGLYCTYILNLSCGSVVNWVRKTIMHNYKGEEKDFFSYIEKNIKDEPSGVLVLPYFGGASTPYQNINAKGVIVGLDGQTDDSTLYRAVLEGTAMEMKLNADTVLPLDVTIKGVTATGGGANSKKWLQIKADIQNIPIKALRSGEGGLCGCAMFQAVAMGAVKDLFEAKEIFVQYKDEFVPKDHKKYQAQYEKYKKLYLTVKELF